MHSGRGMQDPDKLICYCSLILFLWDCCSIFRRGWCSEMCEFQQACFYFSLIQFKPVSLEYLKEEYCSINYSRCARYMISKAHGPYHVPKYLFPEDIQDACK